MNWIKWKLYNNHITDENKLLKKNFYVYNNKNLIETIFNQDGRR
jgi:hypothetical protein